MRRIAHGCSLVLACSTLGCLVIFSSGSIERSETQELERRRVESPMKAFFGDGATAVFPDGAEITADSIVGQGRLYSVGLTDTTAVSGVSLESLVGIEAFQGQTNVAASVMASLGLTALGTVGSVALFKAIFGSCPTFYALTDDGPVLQAEAFSYSIAPLLEGRDLDATDLVADPDGIVRLELRNEALETHYINHLDLVAVDHAAGVRVMPSDRDLPMGVTTEVGPIVAVDRQERDVLRAVSSPDGEVFSSSTERIRAASDEDPFDHVELTFPRPEEGDPVLVLRLRNSLLTTVLFYDMMLGRAGAEALDWIGLDMARIGTVVELGSWFQAAMGLTVEVHDGQGWVAAGRVPDTGPIAWEEVGIALPVASRDDVRVRLRFLADAWRIDQVSLGRAVQLGSERRLRVARILEDGVESSPATLERIARPDDAYLATYPGTSVLLEFEPLAASPGQERTYLLASQGYYTEWVRPEWIRTADAPVRFRPDDRTVEALMGLWLDRRDTFEADFYDSRVPVR